MPGGNGFRGALVNLSQGRGPQNPQRFFIPFRQPERYVITGITKDSTGAALGNCVVLLFETSSNVIKAVSLSDALGNYLLDGQIDTTYYVVAYRSGAPDVTGATVNTLVVTPA